MQMHVGFAKSKAEVPGPRSPGPPFFGTKGPGSDFSKNEKKVRGPRSAIFKVGKKSRVQGPVF